MKTRKEKKLTSCDKPKLKGKQDEDGNTVKIKYYEDDMKMKRRCKQNEDNDNPFPLSHYLKHIS